MTLDIANITTTYGFMELVDRISNQILFKVIQNEIQEENFRNWVRYSWMDVARKRLKDQKVIIADTHRSFGDLETVTRKYRDLKVRFSWSASWYSISTVWGEYRPTADRNLNYTCQSMHSPLGKNDRTAEQSRVKEEVMFYRSEIADLFPDLGVSILDCLCVSHEFPFPRSGYIDSV